MSDENVGGLVALPPCWTYLHPMRLYTDLQMREYATACVEAALSAHGQPVVDAVLLADLNRCMDDVATEMRARGRSDSRFVQLSARITALTGAAP